MYIFTHPKIRTDRFELLLPDTKTISDFLNCHILYLLLLEPFNRIS